MHDGYLGTNEHQNEYQTSDQTYSPSPVINNASQSKVPESPVEDIKQFKTTVEKIEAPVDATKKQKQ